MGPPAKVGYRHIDEINNWFVQRVEVLPPSLVKIKAEGGEPIGLVATVPEPSGTAILKFSALRGFKSMTVEHLRRLALYLEIACAKQPSTEIEWVTMLVKHCVPLISDADLALALDSRRMRAKPRFDTEMTMANIHVGPILCRLHISAKPRPGICLWLIRLHACWMSRMLMSLVRH